MDNRHVLEEAIRFGQILGRFLLGKSSEQENKHLEAWMKETEENKQLLQEMNLEKELRERILFYKRIDPREEWRKSPFQKTGKSLRWAAYAASAVIVLSVGIYCFLPKQQEIIIAGPSVIQPGKYKAVLYTGTGEEIRIHENADMVVNKDSSLVVRDNQLIYQNCPEPVEEEVVNRLVVPRGGEFKLCLPDGTQVWINSNTVLKYPAAFNRNSRTVELEGEAYFVVAPDSLSPFVVKTGKAQIKVYGTAFNVSAYHDDGLQYTTLEHGRIGLLVHDQEYILQPGDQALLNDQGVVDVRQVNAVKAGLWRDGFFSFENESLEEIMKKLSRWYDVEVFFMDERTKYLHFTGDINRFESILQILEVMELTTNISMTIKNRTVTIQSK